MLRENLSVSTPLVALVTVTAPGADRLPWARFEPRRVEPSKASEWNRTCRARWSRMHRAARSAVERSGHRPAPIQSAVWQLQGRGVLHLHLVLPFASPAHVAAVKAYVRELRRLAPEYGFGFIDFRDRDGKTGRRSVLARDRAANYLSRYATDSAQLLEAAALPKDERPHRLVYVSRELTAFTRCTMKRLRRVRFLYWIRRGESWVVFANAGRYPRWFADPTEHAAVAALARAP
jgi:hypothetical protein